MENPRPPGAKSAIRGRRTINIFVLTMFAVVVSISLRNLPVAAQFGFASLFFFIAGALLFMIPYTLICAEMASTWPKEGGIFIWVKEALGEKWGFFAVWMQWYHNMTWYPVMLAFMGSGIAYLFLDPKLAGNSNFLLSVILIGIWTITGINFFGVKLSTWLSTCCVLIGTIFPALFLIILAVNWIGMGKPLAIAFTWKDFMPQFNHFSNIVFLAGIFLALAGMELTANLARDVKRPQRNYPKAILIGTAISLTLASFASMAIAAVIPKESMSLVAGIYEAFKVFFASFHMEWVVPVMAFFTLLGAFGEINACTIAGVKGLYATSEHGLLPPLFHKTNKRCIPTNLLLFQALVVSVAAFAFVYLPNVNFSFWVLSAINAQMYSCVYLLLFISGVVLRYKKPAVFRPYRVPFGNVGIWVAAILGFSAALFALFISFFPPASFQVDSVLRYELTFILGLSANIALPFAIYFLRKPHWKNSLINLNQADSQLE